MNRIEALLGEHNTESHLYNLIYKSFPHELAIDCAQTESGDSSKAQLAVLLQKSMDSLSVYSKVSEGIRVGFGVIT